MAQNKMRLVELEPKFYRYELRVEEVTKIDPVFSWDYSRGEYFDTLGRSWTEAGRPTLTLPGEREYLIPVDNLVEAQCIMFFCPKCFLSNGGPVGTHSVQMPFSNRGVDERHKHQWDVDRASTNFDNLSTTPSYRIVGGCGWHGYITNGDVTII